MNDDPNKSYIQAIKLPSGNTYYIKDGEARVAITSAETAIASHSADIAELWQQVAGGVSFKIVWIKADYESETAPGAAKLARIPNSVTVYYNNGLSSVNGTLEPSEDTVGSFYLIYSPNATAIDIYDEYVTLNIGETTAYSWEKIGDTQIDLSDVVTDVTLSTSKTSVIGSSATFSVTQPTVTLEGYAQAPGPGGVEVVASVAKTTTYLGATAAGGGAAWNSKDSKTVVTSVGASTTNVKATASGANVAWNSKDSKTVLTGVKTNNTNVKATASGGGASWNSKDETTVVTSVGASTTNVKATASGGGAAWNSKDLKTVVTSVSASTAKLATATIKTLSASNTTASKATAGTNQTTLKSTFTTSTTNTDWLKGATVSNEVLSLGAATHDTQTTTQFTFSDVTVPVRNDLDITVATGQTTTGIGGANIATGVEIGSSVSVIGQNATFTNTQPTIALSSGATAGTGVIALAYDAIAASTDKVIGSDATFTNTQPTIALSSGATAGSGVIALAYGAAANGTAAVIGGSATFTVTQPAVALESGATAGTGVIALAYNASATGTASVIGYAATLTNTQPTVSLSSGSTSGTGKVQIVANVNATTSYIYATATGANVTWGEKDIKNAISSASITVYKGGNTANGD